MLLLKCPWTCRWEESPVAYAVAGRNACHRTVGDGNETFLVWRRVGMRASVALSGVCFWSWFTISLWEDINNRIKCTLKLSPKLKCSSPSHCQKFKLKLRFKPRPRLQLSRFLPICSYTDKLLSTPLLQPQAVVSSNYYMVLPANLPHGSWENLEQKLLCSSKEFYITSMTNSMGNQACLRGFIWAVTPSSKIEVSNQQWRCWMVELRETKLWHLCHDEV